MRHILITAVAATLALSQAAWAQGTGGTSSGAAGTGGNAASTAGTSSAAVSGQSLGAGNVPTQPGITPGSSNPGGVNGGLGNSGIPQQAPGTNSLGTANSAGGATGGGAAGGSAGTTVGRSSVDVTGPNKPGSLDVTDPLQKQVDKKINGICRGC